MRWATRDNLLTLSPKNLQLTVTKGISVTKPSPPIIILFFIFLISLSKLVRYIIS
nr:hypothetical protein [Mycoplasmopsis bovis]